MTYGYIHSYESFGAVDGPGLRFVVFMSGCPMRCLYCHNPDTWKQNRDNKVTPDELIEKIIPYKNFIANGGVTVSGGEPLMQAEFCEEFILKCKRNKLHTAIDTSGIIPLSASAKAIELADLILLDIKDIDDNDCITLTGHSNKNALETLDYCEKIGKPVWIRHVILPQYTLKPDKLKRLAQYLKPFKCIQKIELLPYHTIGKYKWDELNLNYKLEGIEPPSDEDVNEAKRIFGLIP